MCVCVLVCWCVPLYSILACVLAHVCMCVCVQRQGKRKQINAKDLTTEGTAMTDAHGTDTACQYLTGMVSPPHVVSSKHAPLLARMHPSEPSPTTFNRRSGRLRMPERQKADCGTALWPTLPCGIHTCCCDLRFEEKPARFMLFCPFPEGMGSQAEGGVQRRTMPSILCFLLYDALSHHAYVFLFARMHLEEGLPTQGEILPHKDMPTQ